MSTGPLLRASLLKLADDDHVLVLNTHHIISDRWSLGVLSQELAALYEAFLENQPSPLAGTAHPVRRLRGLATAVPIRRNSG